ncbi:MAG: hypothetical protein AB7O96_14840 [Pseudobdellovibrionaceae bacterium]
MKLLMGLWSVLLLPSFLLAQTPPPAPKLPLQQSNPPPPVSGSVDCSRIYGGKPTQCKKVKCENTQSRLIGTWKGNFFSYTSDFKARERKKRPANDPTLFRPYTNTTVYSSENCLTNEGNGEVFVIANRTDDYPTHMGLIAKKEEFLMVQGHKKGVPFLRIIDSKNIVSEFKLEYANEVGFVWVWTMETPKTATSPERRIDFIVMRDFSSIKVPKMYMKVTLSIGPRENPTWAGVISYGSRSKILREQKESPESLPKDPSKEKPATKPPKF